jgi:hypothetical protein
MQKKFEFTYENLEKHYLKALSLGYKMYKCIDYFEKKNTLPLKIIVNRIDLDFSVKKTDKILDIFEKLDIKGTFFIRLHAKEYNPFDFDNYRIINRIIKSGNEIGYHSEVIDESAIWNEKPDDCLRRDIKVFNSMFNTEIKGIASHGGMTGLNNLDFWNENKPSDFGVMYEAYDDSGNFGLFKKSFYISDSEWTHWKCYDKGNLLKGNIKTFGEHLDDGHDLIYLLIHSDTFYTNHFYE